MTRTLGVIISLLITGSALAASGDGEGPPSTYLDLDPAFVVNLGKAESRGRSYMKAEVTLRFHEAEMRKKAEKHSPWLRHELVMLMSGKPVERMQSAEGQAALRREARTVLNERLKQELQDDWKAFQEKQQQEEASNGESEDSGEGNESSTEKGMIREVLFPNFIVQVR